MTRSINHVVAVGLMALALGSSAYSSDQPVVDGEVWRQQFDILREGKPVGFHKVVREVDDALINVTVTSRIEVRFLTLTLYRFEYDAQETWDELGLRTLRVVLDDDGDTREFEGRRRDDVFEWVSDGVRYRHPMPVFPTNHWNPAVLEQDKVLNTLTGEMDQVEIMAVGREAFLLAARTTQATRYRYSGQLELESWYDDWGQWVGMRFETEDGSTIEYRCRDCRPGIMM